MEITLLIKTFVVLVILLAILIFFLLRAAKAKRLKLEQSKIKKSVKKPISLNELRDRLKSKTLNSAELKATMDLVVRDYGVIDDFKIYVDIILRMTRHPSVNKDIIISFERELSRLNPKFSSSIEHNIGVGLDTRSR